MQTQEQEQEQQWRICQCGCGESIPLYRVYTRKGKTITAPTMARKRFLNQRHQIRAWEHNNPDKVKAYQRAFYQRRQATKTKVYKVRIQYKNTEKFCRRCNTMLSPGLGDKGNWRPCNAREHNYICKNCDNKLGWPRPKQTLEQKRASSRKYYYTHKASKLESVRRYKRENKEKINAYSRAWRERKKAEKEKLR